VWVLEVLRLVFALQTTAFLLYGYGSMVIALFGFELTHIGAKIIGNAARQRKRRILRMDAFDLFNVMKSCGVKEYGKKKVIFSLSYSSFRF